MQPVCCCCCPHHHAVPVTPPRLWHPVDSCTCFCVDSCTCRLHLFLTLSPHHPFAWMPVSFFSTLVPMTGCPPTQKAFSFRLDSDTTLATPSSGHSAKALSLFVRWLTLTCLGSSSTCVLPPELPQHGHPPHSLLIPMLALFLQWALTFHAKLLFSLVA